MTDYALNKAFNQSQMMKYKSVPCHGCGLEWHPSVMTLDHPGRRGKYKSSGGKTMHPNKMLTYDPLAFKTMLEQLVPLCMNCHAFLEKWRDKQLSDIRWHKFNKRIKAGALLADIEGSDLVASDDEANTDAANPQ